MRPIEGKTQKLRAVTSIKIERFFFDYQPHSFSFRQALALSLSLIRQSLGLWSISRWERSFKNMVDHLSRLLKS